MCGGSSPEPPPDPVYVARDGREFDNPQEAQEWDRRIALADAFGYSGPIKPEPIYETQTVTVQPGEEGYPEPERQRVGKGDNAYVTTVPQTGPQTVEQQVQTGTTSGLQDYLQEEGLTDQFQEYWNQGLTAADYRTEQRLKEQKQEEENRRQEREDAIAEGRDLIKSSFGDTFGPGYYDEMEQSALDYYMPQLRDQYDTARENVVYDLARKGTLHSSMAGDAYGDLDARFEQQKSDIVNRARNMTQQARDAVSSAKDSLLQYNQAVADPQQIDDRVTSAVDRVQARAPELTPLGQVFGDYMTPALSSAASVAGSAAKKYGPSLFNTSRGDSGYNVQR